TSVVVRPPSPTAFPQLLPTGLFPSLSPPLPTLSPPRTRCWTRRSRWTTNRSSPILTSRSLPSSTFVTCELLPVVKVIMYLLHVIHSSFRYPMCPCVEGEGVKGGKQRRGTL